jgi:hypothetical protein
MLRVCRAMLRHEGARVFLLGAVPAVIKTTLSSVLPRLPPPRLPALPPTPL